MSLIKRFLSLVLFIFIAACGPNQNDDVWVVGTSADNPPYEFIKDNKVVGFDIDLIKAIAKEAGKEVEIKNMDFHGLIAALNSNNIEMVIAGMSVTPQRQKVVDFSVSYTGANISILTRAEDKITSESRLEGKEVGSQLGTIWAIAAYNLAHRHDFKTMTLSSNLMLVEDLKNKRIDAVVLEEYQAQEFVEKNPGLSSFKVRGSNSNFAIALPKGSKVLDNVNKAIRVLEKNGVIDELLKKWELK